MKPTTTVPKLALNKSVFFSSALLSLFLIVATISFPDWSQKSLTYALRWVSDTFGWYYMLVVAGYCLFTIFIGLSSFGSIKLGQDHDKPDFSYTAWAAMLFSAGLGISLLFFGVSEPLTHYLTPNVGPGGTPLAMRQAMVQTFLHWGLHGWGIYALIGMTLAYFAYRHNLSLSLHSALVPIVGEKRAQGWMGKGVDTFGVVCTLLGLATSLGIGVLQAGAGLKHVFGIDSNHFIQTIIIVLITIAAALSASSGVGKGVRRLSEINMLGATIILIALLVMGPTVFLLNAFSENIGDYFQHIIMKTFDVYAYEGAKGNAWKASWTIFFWAWWVAWAPFVGLFIARISRGRTLREFTFGVMFIPLGFIFAWFSVFGNSGYDLVVHHGVKELGEMAVKNPAMGMFILFDQYPLSSLWSVLAMIVGFIFFITSADSGALVLANLSSRNLASGADAPIWLRVFWAAATGLITLGLLFAGGLNSLQAVSVLAGLPFSLVLILYMVSMFKSLRLEGMKRKAGNMDMATVLNQGRSWRERLGRIVSYPSYQEVHQFMQKCIHPAMQEVEHALKERHINAYIEMEDDGDFMQLTVEYEGFQNFIYKVQVIEAIKPVLAFAQSSNLSNNPHYYRAEVHLAEGSQDYDVVGFNKEQLIIDMLNQYERHMQFLHLASPEVKV